MSNIFEFKPASKQAEKLRTNGVDESKFVPPSDIPVFTCGCGNRLHYVMKSGVLCPECGNFTEPTK